MTEEPQPRGETEPLQSGFDGVGASNDMSLTVLEAVLNRVIGAFSEEAAARLTGLTVGQLRAWDRTGFFEPSFAADNRRQPYSRVYSFRDLVSLRVLNSLRNEHRVSLQHLRRVSQRLAHLGEDKWTSQTLYVLGRKVVFDDPRAEGKVEVVSGQKVFNIPLRVAVADTKKAIATMNERGSAELGQIVSKRFTMNNRPVFDGTRIPVSAVIHFLQRGFDTEDILAEYPELTAQDVLAARAELDTTAA